MKESVSQRVSWLLGLKTHDMQKRLVHRTGEGRTSSQNAESRPRESSFFLPLMRFRWSRNDVSSMSNRFHVNPQADAFLRINAHSAATLISWRQR